MKDTYIHYGARKFLADMFLSIKNAQYSSFGTKPEPHTGLWASPVSAEYGWKEWSKSNRYDKTDFNHSFQFTLANNANVAYIWDVDDLSCLPGQFIQSFPNDSIPPIYAIDFEECVRRGIDAIELCDVTEELYYALYGWDCECILILNKDVIIPQ